MFIQSILKVFVLWYINIHDKKYEQSIWSINFQIGVKHTTLCMSAWIWSRRRNNRKILNNEYIFLQYILRICQYKKLFITQLIVGLFNLLWNQLVMAFVSHSHSRWTSHLQLLSFGCMNIMLSKYVLQCNERCIGVFVYIGTEIGCSS